MTTHLLHLPAKLCTRCSVSKPRSEFSEHWQQTHIKRYRATNAYCKTCSAAIAKERHALNRDRINAAARKSKLKTVYGLTVEDYDQMLANQGGGCAICHTTVPRGMGRFCVDHCHATGRVRGLLCNECNRGIGALKDDPDRLRGAIAYLEQFRG